MALIEKGLTTLGEQGAELPPLITMETLLVRIIWAGFSAHATLPAACC